MSRLWPNADRSEWNFDLQEYIAADSMIPALAGLDTTQVDEIDYRDLQRRLQLPAPAPEDSADSGIRNLRVVFEGTLATPNGPKQHLLASDVSLLAKTPDGRTTRRGGPIFGGSQAFVQAADWMGYVSIVNGVDSSFTILRSPIEAGASFRQDLLYHTDSTAAEYGWVVGRRSVEIPAGTYDNALEIVYFVDEGQQCAVNDQGECTRWFRAYRICTVLLVEDVGPVYQLTIAYLNPPIPELDISSGVYFCEMRLRSLDIRDVNTQ